MDDGLADDRVTDAGRLVATLAHEVAHIHTGSESEEMADLVGMMLLYRYGHDEALELHMAEYRQRMRDVRDLLEDPAEQVNFLVGGSEGDRFTLKRGANHSLTGFSREDLVVPELERYYGLFVIGEMLRQRMGDEPFFSAMDEVFRLNRGGTATTEDFLQAWQNRTESDLGPFFDFWIRGGPSAADTDGEHA